MCKILTVLGVAPDKTKELQDLCMASVPHLTAGDDDAFGYAALSKSKGMFGERWVDVNDAFECREPYGRGTQKLIERTDGLVDLERSYNEFGIRNFDDTFAIMLHARLSTAGGGLENAHPFVSKDTALIHNGVIDNSWKLGKINSTCDSESILKLYLDYGVNDTPTEIVGVTKELEGYYACTVATEFEGVWIIDIFKDDGANLYIAMLPGLGPDAIAVCTSKEILYKTCRDAEIKITTVARLKSDYMLRFIAEDGGLYDSYKFDSNYSWGKHYAGGWDNERWEAYTSDGTAGTDTTKADTAEQRWHDRLLKSGGSK